MIGISFMLAPLLMSSEKYLPLKIWLPFELTGMLYWIFYAWQWIFLIYPAGIANNSFDCLFVFLIMQTCSQFDILALRLLSIPQTCDSRMPTLKKDKNILAKCKQHHEKIFK